MNEKLKIHSGKFGNRASASILAQRRFGSRGSWVQIPPRRPYLNQQNHYAFAPQKEPDFCIGNYPFFTPLSPESFRVFGKNSGKTTIRFFDSNSLKRKENNTAGESVWQRGGLFVNIDVEDCWWLDPRRDLLKDKIGFVADAVALRMWRLGLEHWKDEKGLIPRELFFSVPHAQEFLNVKLAEDRGEHIYVKGSNKRFSWYHEGIERRREAGLRSAEVRKERYGTAVPVSATNNPRTETEQKPNRRRTKPNETEPPSPSPSPSPSPTTSTTTSILKERKKKKSDPATPSAPFQIKVAFCESYREEYGTDYPWTAANFRQAKILAESFGLERACDFARAFPKFIDRWATENGHRFDVLSQNIPKLDVALRNPTRGLLKLAEAKNHERETLGEVTRVMAMSREVQKNEEQRARDNSHRQQVRESLQTGTARSVFRPSIGLDGGTDDTKASTDGS